jgi:hypothetical protein
MDAAVFNVLCHEQDRRVVGERKATSKTQLRHWEFYMPNAAVMCGFKAPWVNCSFAMQGYTKLCLLW